MELSFTYSRKNLFLSQLYRNSISVRSRWSFLGIFLFIFFLQYNSSNDFAGALFTSFIVTTLSSIVGNAIGSASSTMQVKSGELIKLTLTDDGLIVKSSGLESKLEWPAVQGITIGRNFLYVAIGNRNHIRIPQNAFKSDSEKLTFIGCIEKKSNAS